MLKQVTVPIIVDDHDPKKCSQACRWNLHPVCNLFCKYINNVRCKQCLEEAK